MVAVAHGLVWPRIVFRRGVVVDSPNLVVCVCVCVSREFKAWFPPIRVLMLHEAGESKAVMRMSSSEVIKLAWQTSSVLLMTYSGLRLAQLSAIALPLFAFRPMGISKVKLHRREQ
jgi:hypothetical protein